MAAAPAATWRIGTNTTPKYANALQDALADSDRGLKLCCAVAVFITWSVAGAVLFAYSVAVLMFLPATSAKASKHTGNPSILTLQGGKNADYLKKIWR